MLEDDKSSKKKRKDHNVPTNFQLAANLIGSENVCKSCIQLNDGNFASASRDRTIKYTISISTEYGAPILNNACKSLTTIIIGSKT